MSWAADAVGLPIAGSWDAGQALGIGVKGSELPAAGESGPSYLYHHATLPGDNDVEFRGLFTSIPSGPGITFSADEYGRITFSAPDGTYTAFYDLYRDGVLDAGSPHAIYLQVGLAGTVIAISDAGTAVDTPAPPVVAITITDNGNAIESGQLGGLLKQVMDAGAGAELLAEAASVALSDTGAGAEVTTLTAILSLADSGLGMESGQLGGLLRQVIDAGAAIEAAGAEVTISANDVGTGADVASFRDRFLQVFDGAIAVDLASRFDPDQKTISRVEMRLTTMGVTAVLRSIKIEVSDNES